MTEIKFINKARSSIYKELDAQLKEFEGEIELVVDRPLPGYKGEFNITITHGSPTFTVHDFKDKDVSRFPVRIKSVATLLMDRGWDGEYMVTHAQGVISIKKIKKRNLAWTRDEILLSLDLYKSGYPTIPDENSKEVVELSELLRSRKYQIDGLVPVDYRSPNAVYMKMMNFQYFNPEYSGAGLRSGSKLHQKLVSEFWDKPHELRKIADGLRAAINTDESMVGLDDGDDAETAASEGKKRMSSHFTRERNSSIVHKKKDIELKSKGRLVCEVCGFDFEKIYGVRGKGFIECHHIKPISEIEDAQKTTLDDLALVCSNCHRMIHKSRPWLSISELKNQICKN